MRKITKGSGHTRLVEQADGFSGSNYHRFLKRKKRRVERRKAKLNPECLSTYKRFNGYEL